MIYTVQQASYDEVQHVLAPAKSSKTDPENRFDLGKIAHAGTCWKVSDEGGHIVAAYVLEVVGREVWVSAAAGRADVDLTAVIEASLMKQAGDFDSVIFRTARLGLIKKAFRHGYTCLMRKDLK